MNQEKEKGVYLKTHLRTNDSHPRAHSIMYKYVYVCSSHVIKKGNQEQEHLQERKGGVKKKRMNG